MRHLAFAAALLLSACTYTPNIRTDFDPAANFAGYRTYSWIPVEVPRGMNPLMFRRVQASIDRALAARGYTQADSGDFAIAFTIVEDERTEVHGYGSYWGGWGWGGWGGGWGSRWGLGWGWPYGGYVDTDRIYEHSLIVDIYDARTKLSVWHAVARKDTYSEELNYAKIDEAVNLVLAKFPPQPETLAKGPGG